MLKRCQLQKQARAIIAKYLTLCGLDMRCTRISVVAGLVGNVDRAWATIKNTGDSKFIMSLEADLCRDHHSHRIPQVVGHEIAHLLLSDCGLSHEVEEQICDMIGELLVRAA